MPNNYDRIAFIYDRLSSLVFGKALIKAQTKLLPYINKNDRVLIAGGGTGWIIEEITGIHPSGLQIDYIDCSHKMISKSKTRHSGSNKITFFQKAVENTNLNQSYDVIITGFFFDNFELRLAEHIFGYLDSLLNPGGRWLFVDFTKSNDRNRIWQKLMLRIMYGFFRMTCHIEAAHLTDMTPIYKKAGYHSIFELMSYGNFIRSIVYKKT